MKTYSELITIPDFRKRFEYLKLDGSVGINTFGSLRYLYEDFLHSHEWRMFRRSIIIRDNACEMGLEDYPIAGFIYLHHINPIRPEDLEKHFEETLMNPENIISVSFNLHNAIHYGNFELISPDITIRTPNDTCPWRK